MFRSLKNTTFGERTLILYFTIFYFFPILANYFVDTQIKYKLYGDLNFFHGLWFSILYIIVLFFLRKKVNLNIKLNLSLFHFVKNKYVTFCLFLIFLVCSINFYIEFSSSFRHQNEFSNSGLLPIVTFALKAICASLIFCSLSSLNFIKLKLIHYLLFIIAISFSFAGSYDVLYAILAFVGIFLLYRKRNIRKTAFRGVVGVLGIILTVPAILFAGMANKLGVDGAYNFFLDGGMTIAIDLLLSRSFYHAYSLTYHLTFLLDTFQLWFHSIDIVSTQSFRRLIIILGGESSVDSFETVSRLNYILISGGNYESDAGASPGLLGSIFYLPGSILFLPIHLVIIYNAIGLLDDIMVHNRYSIVVYLGGVIVLQALCDSIMDKLNPFSIGFISLFMYLVLASSARSARRNKTNYI